MTKIVIFHLPYLCNRKYRTSQQQDILRITRVGLRCRNDGSVVTRWEQAAIMAGCPSFALPRRLNFDRLPFLLAEPDR